MTTAFIKSARPSKIHYTEYIRTDNQSEEGAAVPSKPAEPTKPEAE